ncbi:hypothetical protein [Chryseobacterium indologenes]|uniref:hypothetical protein n=1 Tax=Chryseobacterium indologenes TaxID=253 RepID=UPI00188837A8|nr:hypothetical protein [Chryseobacterium indologenes]
MKIAQDIYSVGGKSNTAAVFFNKVKDPTHTNFKANNTDSLISGKWLPWGDNNLYPQDFEARLKKTGVAIGGLEVLTAAHFGTGFQLYQGVETEEAITFKERLASSFPEINDFFTRAKFNITISEIILDYETWRVAFPEYLLSPNGDQIISVRRIKAADCRFEVPDTNGVINNIGVNTDWANYKDENTVAIPCFASNIPIDEIKEYCKQKGIRKFTIPVIDSLLVEKTYPSVGWHSSFKNGWVDVVLSLPEFKKTMFQQQLNVKYVIHIADDYFAHIYASAWDSFSDQEKQKKRTELVDLIDTELRGNKGAGKSIISPYFRDRNSGELIKGIQVETITQPQSSGEFLLDGSAANYEILTPMGIDPCLINGGAFGGKSLSGSGSDKREAWTILCAKFPIKQIRTLQIFENIKYWNNWDPTLFGKFPNTNLTTLDKNPNGQTKVVN